MNVSALRSELAQALADEAAAIILKLCDLAKEGDLRAIALALGILGISPGPQSAAAWRRELRLALYPLTDPLPPPSDAA